MQLGATIDLLGSFANVKKFFRELDKRPISGFGMVPASWNYISSMSDDLIGEYADQLKYIEIGSAPMPIDQKQRLIRLLPHTRICMHYGLTEASRSAFMCFGEEEDLTTIGSASPNVELKIFTEDGQECKTGEQGGRNIQGLIEKPTYNYYANAGIYFIKLLPWIRYQRILFSMQPILLKS